jgi:hypothetical protein
MRYRKNAVKEVTLEDIEKHNAKIHKINRGIALTSVAIGLLNLYCKTMYGYNDDQARMIQAAIDNGGAKKVLELVKKNRGLKTGLHFERNSFWFELLWPQGYLDECTEDISKTFNVKKMEEQAGLQKATRTLEENLNEYGGQMGDVVRAGAPLDLSKVKEVSEHAIYIDHLVTAVNYVLENFNSLESRMFMSNTRGEKNEKLKSIGVITSNIRAESLRIKEFHANYFPAIVGDSFFNGDKSIIKTDFSMLILSILYTESGGDHTATGRYNPLDHTGYMLQVKTALGILTSLKSRPEFEPFLKTLALKDGNGKPISVDEFCEVIDKNLETIKRINVKNLIISDNQRRVSQYESILVGENPIGEFNPPDSTLLKDNSGISSALSSENYSVIQGLISRMVSPKDGKITPSEMKELKESLDKKLTHELKASMRKESSSRKAVIEKLSKSISSDPKENYLNELFSSLFNPSMASVFCRYYGERIFEKKLFWEVVDKYHRHCEKDLEKAILTIFYGAAYIGGEGRIKSVGDELIKSGYNVNKIITTRPEGDLIRILFERGPRLAKTYERIKSYKREGFFELNPEGRDNRTTIIYDAVKNIGTESLEQYGKRKLKEFGFVVSESNMNKPAPLSEYGEKRFKELGLKPPI